MCSSDLKLGADTVRMYLAFIGPYNEVGSYPWDMQGIQGIRKFLDRIWLLIDEYSKQPKADISTGQQKIVWIARGAVVDKNELVFPEGATEPQIAAALAQLETLGIVVQDTY